MAGFRSLRQRLAGPANPNEVLPLNVLPYMRRPLLDWLVDACGDLEGGRQYWKILCQMLKIDYTGKRPYAAAVEAADKDNDLLLDLIDARLKFETHWRYFDVLKNALFLAGSGWRLNDSRDGLEQVVDGTVRAQVTTTIDHAHGSASDHLANAWAATFGRDKNPTHAHAEMVRAVESAAVPVVTPKDQRATLGTILGQLDSQSALYTTSGASAANDGIGALIAMMKVLWQQQTDRHGASPTIPATQERVEFLMPIASALVHAFSTGAVRRRK